MIIKIEDAIVARLKDKGLEAGEIKIQKGVEGIVKPAVYVSTEEGKFQRITDTTYKQVLGVHVYIVFKHLKNEAERRRGIYPLIQGAIGILALQKLGLKIDPLKPISLRNVTDDDLNELGLIAYQIVFETAFNIDKMSDEEATDLLTTGLSYYLQPGDSVKDAEDTVTLGA